MEQFHLNKQKMLFCCWFKNMKLNLCEIKSIKHRKSNNAKYKTIILIHYLDNVKSSISL